MTAVSCPLAGVAEALMQVNAAALLVVLLNVQSQLEFEVQRKEQRKSIKKVVGSVA